MIQGAVNAIEQVRLPGINVVVGAPSPNKPVHPVNCYGCGVWVAPEDRIIEIRQIDLHRHVRLAQLRKAPCGLRLLLGFGERGEQQRGQDCDNRNDDQ